MSRVSCRRTVSEHNNNPSTRNSPYARHHERRQELSFVLRIEDAAEDDIGNSQAITVEGRVSPSKVSATDQSEVDRNEREALQDEDGCE